MQEMNVAGYVRVSTEKQREQDSHKRQRERLQQWADEKGHDIEFYQDIAISGQSDEREAYDELMSEVEQYDAVVVREMSRFGRSLQKVCGDIEDLQDRGVDFVSLKEDIDMTTAQGKLMLHIIAAFNQFWADWSRERAMEYVEQARENGDPLGRPKKLDKHQMKQVYEWRDHDMSYNTIAKLCKVEWDIDIDQSTIYRYCKDREEEEA